jgi:hypothetical protein
MLRAHRCIRGLALVALAALVGGLSGCGGVSKYDVTGKVTYNGAPLAKPDGQIVFVGPEGTQVTAPISEEGTYTAVNVVSGSNRVAVTYKNPSFAPPARPKGVPGPNDRPVVTSPTLTPEKYASAEKSGLTVEVKEGTVFNVEMTGPNIP